jgi:hypothetical protein
MSTVTRSLFAFFALCVAGVLASGGCGNGPVVNLAEDAAHASVVLDLKPGIGVRLTAVVEAVGTPDVQFDSLFVLGVGMPVDEQATNSWDGRVDISASLDPDDPTEIADGLLIWTDPLDRLPSTVDVDLEVETLSNSQERVEITFSAALQSRDDDPLDVHVGLEVVE